MTELNKQQKEASEDIYSNSLIIAGPGTGKTKTLVERIKNTIIKEGRSDHILVLTFTEKATEEIKERLISELGVDQVNDLFVSTFHGFCNKILSEYHDLVGKKYEVIDEFSRYSFFISRVNQLFQGKYVSKAMFLSLEILNFYDFIASNEINLEEIFENTEIYENNDTKIPLKEVLSSYLKYEKLLNKLELIDYSHLQKILYYHIKNNKSFLDRLRKRFKFIFIDEHQDTDPLQDKIIQIMSNHGKEMVVCAVGDEDQSIYGFRGATIENFRNFQENYVNVNLHYLTINYRSYEEIVNFYDNYMKDKRKYPKKIVSYRGKSGNDVILKSYSDKYDEVNKIIGIIKEAKKKGAKYGDIAILFRSVKGQAKNLIRRLDMEKIPYSVEGLNKFFENEYVKKVLFLLSKTYDTLDILEKIYVKRKIDLLFIDEFIEYVDLNKENKISTNYYKIINKLELDSLNEVDQKMLGLLSELILDYERFNNNMNFRKFLNLIHHTPDQIISEKIKEIEVTLDAVRIMTIHQSKGLEFPMVIIGGLNKKYWFKYRKGNPFIDMLNNYINRIPKKDNEDYNVLYVAMSRAMDVLVLVGNINFLTYVFKDKIYILNSLSNETKINKIESKKETKITKKKYDFSMLNNYLTCPYLYNKTYKFGFKQPSYFSQEYGKLLHLLFLAINRKYKNRELIDDQEINKLIEKYLENKDTELILKKESIFYILKEYVNNILGKKIKNILEIEYPIELREKEWVLSGVVDLIFEDDNGNYCILDFKARKLKGIDKTNVKIQLNLYKKILSNRIDKPIKLFAYSMEDNEMIEVEPMEIDSIIENFVNEENINKKNLNNPFCKYCKFKCDKNE